MKHKSIMPQYEEYADIADIIEITRHIDSPKARTFIAWVDSLGREPTTEEFEKFATALGFRLQPTPTKLAD